MKYARLALACGIVLVASPAMAAVNPGGNPGVESQRKPAPGLEKLFQVIVEKHRMTLPLECRGYYVRMKSDQPAAGSLNRCD